MLNVKMVERTPADLLQQLQQSEEITRRILEAVPGGIVLVSGEGEIVDANAQAISILGLSFDELKQRYIQDFGTETIWEDGTPCEPEEYPVSKCLATREPQPEATIGIRRRDGTTRWGVFTATPMNHPGSGAFIGVVVTFVDITQRKEEEERRRRLESQLSEAQRLEAIGRLAGGLAHDLNNILSAILGHASILRDSFPEGTQENEAAHTIEIAGERAAKLTQQLLGFSRRGSMRSAPINIDEIISQGIDLLSATMRTDVRMTHHRASVPPIVTGDLAQLQQVILNLGLNARDAMPGGGDLVFETKVHPDTVRVLIRDTGVGIPEDARSRIFEPFFTTKEAGTGMGLALVYGVIRAHKGQVEVASEPGRGTTLEIVLPRTIAEEEAPPAEPTPAAPAPSKVLVIDDEELVRNTAIYLMRRIGFEGVPAASGAEGVEAYQNGADSFSAVLLDLVMPGMSGDECYRALRAISPTVPVIISSAYDRHGIASDILSDDRTIFLQKPYTVDQLKKVLEAAGQT